MRLIDSDELINILEWNKGQDRDALVIIDSLIKLVKARPTAYDVDKVAEELKELRAYKERMEMQYLKNIDNPLEPLKLQSALQSEIFKYEYRKKHKPQDINILDYTIMYALRHCLEEQIKSGGTKGDGVK